MSQSDTGADQPTNRPNRFVICVKSFPQKKCGRFSISAGENHLISQTSAASFRGVQATACLHCHFLACHLHPCESWGAFFSVTCPRGCLCVWLFDLFGYLFCFLVFSVIYDWFVVQLFLYLIVWIICWVVSNLDSGMMCFGRIPTRLDRGINCHVSRTNRYAAPNSLVLHIKLHWNSLSI